MPNPLQLTTSPAPIFVAGPLPNTKAIAQPAGGNANATLAPVAPAQFVAGTPRTLEFFFLAPAAIPASPLYLLVETNSAGQFSGNGLIILTIDAAGKLSLSIAGATTIAPGASVCDGAWHHVAVIYDGTNSFLRLHADGQYVGGTNAGSLTLPSDATSLLLGLGAPTAEFRASNVVRYQPFTTYTVPTGPFADDSNTTGLWHLNGDGLDSHGAAPPMDFTAGESAPSATVAVGSSANVNVTIAPINGFTGTVTPTLSGLPPGVAGGFVPNSLVGGSTMSTTLTLGVGSTVPTGSYPITINLTDSADSIAHSEQFTLTVAAPANGGAGVAQSGDVYALLMSLLSGGRFTAAALANIPAPPAPADPFLATDPGQTMSRAGLLAIAATPGDGVASAAGGLSVTLPSGVALTPGTRIQVLGSGAGGGQVATIAAVPAAPGGPHALAPAPGQPNSGWSKGVTPAAPFPYLHREDAQPVPSVAGPVGSVVAPVILPSTPPAGYGGSTIRTDAQGGVYLSPGGLDGVQIEPNYSAKDALKVILVVSANKIVGNGTPMVTVGNALLPAPTRGAATTIIVASMSQAAVVNGVQAGGDRTAVVSIGLSST